MQSTVTGKNQISIPAALARELGIKPGARVEWRQTGAPDELLLRVLPDPDAQLAALAGAGRAWAREGCDPVADLVSERDAE